MQYLLLIYENEATWESASEEERRGIYQEYMEFTQRIHEAGSYIAGEALQPVSSATSVRIRDGRALTTDGPFAETREQLGGFYMVEARDLDEAIALAQGIPAVRTGTIEVRPVMPTPKPE